jgi:hypothetical protein
MAEKSLGVFGTTVAAIVSGLAVAGLLALFTYIWPGTEAAAAIVSCAKAAWAAAVWAAVEIGRVFTAPVPLWAFLLLGALCAWLWTRRIRTPSGLPELNGHHRALLELIAVADGRVISHQIAAETLNLRQLIIDLLADELVRHQLIKAFYSNEGRGIGLSDAGRNFVLQNSLMGSEALALRLHEVQQSHKYDWMAR